MRTRVESEHGLTPKLLDLLTISIRSGTTNSKELARAMKRTAGTVHTYWNRIMLATETNSRAEAQLKALRRHWVSLDGEPTPAPATGKRGTMGAGRENAPHIVTKR